MRAVIGFSLGLAVGVFLVTSMVKPARSPSGPAATPADRRAPSGAPAQASLAAPVAQTADLFLVARLRDADSWEELLLAESGKLRTVPLPDTVDHSALPVTDGERIYAYVSGIGRRLVVFTRDGREDETVTDSTSLVEPRGLFVSPNGAFIGFFLDNRETEATEFWVYDTAARTKRVTVEHLTRTDLSGPFFQADGSFLLRNGTQLLRGSPRRTGGEALAAVPPAETLWEAGALLSPDGTRVALVLGVGDAATTVSRVVEIQPGSRVPRTRLSLAGSARLFAWLPPDVLLVQGSDGLWTVRGSARDVRRLPSPASPPAVAGSGDAIAYVEGAAGVHRVTVVDLASGRARTAVALPPAPDATPRSSAAREVPPYLLVQFFRTRAAGAEIRTPPAGAVPAETVLRLVSERIREIAEAPLREPASAERVWFTRTPGAVYVDYRLGTTLWRRLIAVEHPPGSSPTYRMLGLFAPLEGTWTLIRGEDLTDRATIALYEFEPEVGAFVEKPLAPSGEPQ